jgi:hypothetical protein
MAAGEEMGLTHEYLLSLMEECGLRLVLRKRFILWINNLYVFGKLPAIAGAGTRCG